MSSTKPVSLRPDPAALETPLDQLGWVDVSLSPEAIDAHREHLANHAGIRGLEVVDADEVDAATRIFYRDGFVVVRAALDSDQLEFMRAGCDRVIHEMMALDGARAGNRGSHRYSFGGASLTGHQVHHPEWAMLIDLPTVTPILTSIFGSTDYLCRGGGGDFCLPGAIDYQPLHSDMGDRREMQLSDGRQVITGSFHDPSGRLDYRDLPCPYIACNFLMVDFTPINGPTRQIPGTQHSHAQMPRLQDEPEWMKLSTVCPAPAGSVLIRDPRAWHGGTPNLSNTVRAIPNAEFYAPWYREPMPASMPRSIFENLSTHARHLCRYIVAPPGAPVQTGYRPDLGATPLRLTHPRRGDAPGT